MQTPRRQWCSLAAYLLSYLETGSLEPLLPRLGLPSSESLSAALAAVSPLLSGLLELSAPLSSAAPARDDPKSLWCCPAVQAFGRGCQRPEDAQVHVKVLQTQKIYMAPYCVQPGFEMQRELASYRLHDPCPHQRYFLCWSGSRLQKEMRSAWVTWLGCPPCQACCSLLSFCLVPAEADQHPVNRRPIWAGLTCG